MVNGNTVVQALVRKSQGGILPSTDPYFARAVRFLLLTLCPERGVSAFRKVRSFTADEMWVCGSDVPFSFYQKIINVMKIVFGASLFLILGNSAVYSATGSLASWMLQAGLILLFGALAVFAGDKRLAKVNSGLWRSTEIVSYGLMLFFIAWGFITEQWYLHPLGMLIGIAGGIWAAYRGLRGTAISTTLPISRFIKDNRPQSLQKILNAVAIFLILICGLLTFSIWLSEKQGIDEKIAARRAVLLTK